MPEAGTAPTSLIHATRALNGRDAGPIDPGGTRCSLERPDYGAHHVRSSQILLENDAILFPQRSGFRALAKRVQRVGGYPR
jgi:hypothetical protein